MGADQRGITADRQMTQDGARRDVAHFPSSSPSTIPSAASTTDNSRITASTSLSPPSTERRMRSRAGYSQ